MVEFLASRGANLNAMTDQGRTALNIALQTGQHKLAERLLDKGALLRVTIREHIQKCFKHGTIQIQMTVYWRILSFVRTELSAIDDLRKAVTLTGSVKNAQMLSCEDFVVQTWGDSGLRVLDAVIGGLKTGYNETRITGTTPNVTIETYEDDSMRVTVGGSLKQATDVIEQLSWLCCVFACDDTAPNNGLMVSAGCFRPSGDSTRFYLSSIHSSLDTFSDEVCGTLALGYPAPPRKEGIGLEIPFPLLLRFADISISMDYDGGTILVGSCTILFPSKRLEDGIQWHVVVATSPSEALSQLKAYLGYCSHALLVMSQSSFDLSSLLPRTQSRIEMAREGTTSVGLSIRGVATATVPLGEIRDVEDRLINADRRPILIYDRTNDRGWLVSELILVLHMALTYLNQPEPLPYKSTRPDDGQEVRDYLYKRLEDGQKKTFGMVIDDFLKDFQKLRMAENIGREGRGWRLKLPSSRQLRGWDFTDLTLKTDTWQSGRDTEDMLVILGSNFGDLICPDLQKTKVYREWETVPDHAGLLTATPTCLMQLMQKQVLIPFKDKMASKQAGGELLWYRPMSHKDCNQFCTRSCLLIHEITRRSDQTCTTMNPPRELDNYGAIVFGCASLYHKSLEQKFGL
ncbi:hypothetical protein BGW36DRAFT_414097 [Talaromyces proteolyticus]|uniref:Ankyrin repeat protein n=1 Tax=Talaromyces proteolyticus TaxID=1131652 RepID=A0AAD4L170_9EURO|nr:uncharacterized protein BGW36DRAFT_414097 [Talaromyces proteolyticus]KAH8703635.1 hypothetical protein BGW36DRAFT_414097 [Talaromyces proteolyticus]